MSEQTQHNSVVKAKLPHLSKELYGLIAKRIESSTDLAHLCLGDIRKIEVNGEVSIELYKRPSIPQNPLEESVESPLNPIRNRFAIFYDTIKNSRNYASRVESLEVYPQGYSRDPPWAKNSVYVNETGESSQANTTTCNEFLYVGRILNLLSKFSKVKTLRIGFVRKNQHYRHQNSSFRYLDGYSNYQNGRDGFVEIFENHEQIPTFRQPGLQSIEHLGLQGGGFGW
jgi:hypothetical protein